MYRARASKSKIVLTDEPIPFPFFTLIHNSRKYKILS